MKSPFPGMDPYLEARWGDVHARLATHACEQLSDNLPDDLIARTEEYVEVGTATEDPSTRYSPDVYVTEYDDELAPVPNASVAVAEAFVLQIASEPRTLRRILISDVESRHRVITAIEFLSPSNKVGVQGRNAYRRKRRKFIAGEVNFVEIDLIREGSYILYPPERDLPEELRVPYRACAVRAANPSAVELYAFPLSEKLPAIRIPLRPKDRDVALDLQPLIDHVYAKGKYSRTIDYSTNPKPNLSPADAAWADELLKVAGKR